MEACCSLVSHSLPCISLAGNQISGDPRRLGHGEFNLSRRPRKLSESLRNSSTFPRMALRSNVSEDTDDVFDDLIKKYGKVVFKRKDQKSPGEETNDDTESLSFAVAVAKVANEVKAADIRIDAIGSKIRDLAEKQYGKVASGDMKPNSWTLLDFGDVVVHIFLPEQRDFYNLEEFYGNATSIDLPFENQPPFRS